MNKTLLKKIKKNYTFWRLLFYLILSIFIIIFIVFLVLLYKNHNSTNLFEEEIKISNQQKLNDNYCDNCTRRLLDGVMVEDFKSNPYPVALIIDNHIDARPQSGLSKAKLVYETEAEGNITRYLAFFDINNNIEKIGPIRSARPYFIDWTCDFVDETTYFSALLVHCGGSPSALARIIKEDVYDLNQFYQGGYFWRSKDNYSPHNIFTSTKMLKKYLGKFNLTKANFNSWNFKEEEKGREGENKLNKVKIDFQNSGYEVYWKYNKDNNSYKRFLDNEIHKDAEGNEITAKNIVVQYTPFKVIDDKLRLDIKTIGEGDAVLCQDGLCFKGKWNKKSLKERIRYYNPQEEEFYFNPGTTWIEVVNEKYKSKNIYNKIN